MAAGTIDCGLPVLDGTACTGCGRCVAVCPTGCLAAWGAVVWLPRPAECVRCGVCELVCPAGAVRVPFTPPASPSSAAG
jgi:NAD-dependent dihydropyrimidine dehydrogenase PreA subunit